MVAVPLCVPALPKAPVLLTVTVPAVVVPLNVCVEPLLAVTIPSVPVAPLFKVRFAVVLFGAVELRVETWLATVPPRINRPKFTEVAVIVRLLTTVIVAVVVPVAVAVLPEVVSLPEVMTGVMVTVPDVPGAV